MTDETYQLALGCNTTPTHRQDLHTLHTHSHTHTGKHDRYKSQILSAFCCVTHAHLKSIEPESAINKTGQLHTSWLMQFTNRLDILKSFVFFPSNIMIWICFYIMIRLMFLHLSDGQKMCYVQENKWAHYILLCYHSSGYSNFSLHWLYIKNCTNPQFISLYVTNCLPSCDNLDHLHRLKDNWINH